jgi:hypothetical protein
LPHIRDVARWASEAGAVRIMAHPFGRTTEPTLCERRRVEAWLERYVDGVEMFRFFPNRPYTEMLWEIVSRMGRPFTGGSDSHAYTPADKFSEAPYACLESIREWKARL